MLTAARDDPLSCPLQIPRPHDMPMKASEKTLPTCTGAEFYLTPDETPDWRLVLGYIKERLAFVGSGERENLICL